ncbi:MAG: restriction endonuclease subunit S [Pseudorhodobacter sp.]|nr:restriction endonuclease subunit S [Pseudorhodobacter sp.]
MSVPKLRFPGFAGEWEPAKLADLCALKAGKFIESDQISSDQRDGMYPCYGGNGLRGFVTKYNTIGRYPLVGRQGALCGNVKLATGKYYATEHALIAEPQSDMNVDWLFYQLAKLNLNRFATGVAQPGLSVEVLNGIAAKRPNETEEQQKIAAFLGAVDAKLAALAARQAALGRFKAGLMQKLFSQQLRFTQDDGRAFPDWEEKRLGDICNYFRSGIGITSGQIFETGTYPVYGGNGLRGYCDDFTHDGDFILIGRQGALCGNINWAKGRSYISEHAIAVNSNNLSRIEWLFYRLDDLKLNRLSESSAQPGLSVEKLKRLKLNTPHPAEQQKIAAALSAMDAKVQAVADQITGLEIFKKGLLQQMFV